MKNQSQQKQILVLQDLGIQKEDFEKLVLEAKLPFNIIWQEQDVDSADNVAGIITIKAKIDNQLLAKYPNIQFIAVAFTGYDCVDLDICRQKNIAVYNVPTYSTDSAAELTVGLAISLLREIPLANKEIRSGKWDLGRAGYELSGRTVGILGTGAIGTRVAELFKAFNCKILGWSRTEKEKFKKLGGTYTPGLEDLFSSVDIICVHLPLNADTKNIVGMKQLSAMKETAYLINTARGPIVDKDSLLQILKDNKIAGAAIDVFDQEPISSDDPFLKLPNCILTPHIAYKTNEALKRRAQVTIDNIHNFIDDMKQNRVD